MKVGRATTLTELAFIVGSALEQAGISAVLSGGGAATVYAPMVNQSRDLDFILSYWSSFGVSAKCIEELGFRQERGAYVHDASEFTLEFPTGPLMIGDEVITEWSTLREGAAVLQILSPTDCVRDRLSWFLFYNNFDYSALEQAIAVAVRHEVDLERIEDWALRQGAQARYQVFKTRYLAEK